MLKRALFLFAIGLAFRQIWDFDILHFYGVWLCVAALLLTAPSRALAGCALIVVAIFPLLFVLLPGQLGISFWETTDALTPRDLAIDLFFQGYHPVAPWLAFLFVGMIIGRLDLADRALRRRMLIGGVVLAFACEAIAFALLDLAGVSYDTDLDEAAAVSEEAVKSCALVDSNQKIDVIAKEFNSSSIDFLVRWWSGSTPRSMHESRDQVVRAIKRGLDAAGIGIPFPYVTHTFKEPVPIFGNGEEIEE